MESVDALLAQLLHGEDVESEIGRVRAYRRCVRYAEENLFRDLRCNEFLQIAAERLGQPPIVLPIVHNRVVPALDGRLCFYYHEEDGPVMVGNRSGLDYLGRLLCDLAAAPAPENVVLPEDFPIFVADSYGLVVYHETEEWFDAAEEGLEEDLVAGWEEELQARIVTSDDVAAVQFVVHVSGSLALTLQKLYRVHGMRGWAPNLEGQVLRKPYRRETSRVRVLQLTDDDGQALELGVDLDDPDINFYYDWHLDQLSGG